MAKRKAGKRRKPRERNVANRYLAIYLKRAGLMTGPISKRTRHSSLSVVKTMLLQGRVIRQGYKAYNNFGSAVHLLHLKGKLGKYKLNIIEKRARAAMVANLNAHPIVSRVMAQCPVREKQRYTKLNGVLFRFTPDAHGKSIGMDDKTTACDTLEQFIDAAFGYGYFRQGVTYSTPLKLKEFWIFGIGKKRPHAVFPVLIQSHPEKVRYAEQELKFLLYIYKNYGNPIEQ